MLIADANMMACRLLASALKRHTQFEVVGCVVETNELLAAVDNSVPDVALVNAHLHDGALAGFEVLAQIRDRQPRVKVVLLLDRAEPYLITEAFRAGAKGVFSRGESELSALRRCVHSVYMGQVWANSAELGYVLDAFARTSLLRVVNANGASLLSKREDDVVRLITEGLSNREIAEHLNLSEHTVKNYLFHIFDKLGISTRMELVLYAVANSQRPAGVASSEPTTSPDLADAKR